MIYKHDLTGLVRAINRNMKKMNLVLLENQGNKHLARGKILLCIAVVAYARVKKADF